MFGFRSSHSSSSSSSGTSSRSSSDSSSSSSGSGRCFFELWVVWVVDKLFGFVNAVAVRLLGTSSKEVYPTA